MIEETTQLSLKGIHKLFSQKDAIDSYLLQVIKYFPNNNSECTIELSDGESFVEGILVGEALQHAKANSEFKIFVIIKFLGEDILTKNWQKLGLSPKFELKNFSISNKKYHKAIGRPIPYIEYMLKGYHLRINKEIADLQLVPIKQVLQMQPGKVNGVILAKIVKLPMKINKVLNIIIQDKENDQIQCCIFGSEAQEYFSIFQINNWYKFHNVCIQVSNMNNNIKQLKVIKQSKIVEVKSVQKNKSTEIPIEIPERLNKKQQLSMRSEEHIQFVSSDNIGKKQINLPNCYIIGKFIKQYKLAKDSGRSLSVVDKLNNIVQVVLWKDINDQLCIGQIYKFSHLKAKLYQGKISLHSQWGKTKIYPANQQQVKAFMVNKQSQNKTINNQKNKEKVVTPNNFLLNKDTSIKTAEPKQFILSENNLKYEITDQNCFLLGKVVKQFKMGRDTGRSFDVVDKRSKTIEVVLWNDITDKVTIGQVYVFTHLKARIYQNKVSLQSQKGKTKVQAPNSSDLKFFEMTTLNKIGVADNYKNKSINPTDRISTIGEILNQTKTNKTKYMYYLCQGYLILDMDLYDNNFSQRISKFFFISCKNCQANQLKSDRVIPECQENILVCSFCKQRLNVLWNLKINLINFINQVGCKLNSDVTEKMTGMKAECGLLSLLSTPIDFRLQMYKLNFTRGIFKFNIKVNKRNNDIYYNICQYYELNKELRAKNRRKILQNTKIESQKHEKMESEQQLIGL